MISFYPFKNESDAVTLGDLKIENREDHVAIYGSLAITRDRAGLTGAKALKDLLERIVKELESEHDLPVRVAAAEAPVKVKNPFGQA
ncbi:MAG: hypothetical protein ACLPPF_06345 [Rhodomicrobium sp.]